MPTTHADRVAAKNHPDYSDGYHDGFDGTERDPEGSWHYGCGYDAGKELRDGLFERGFRDDPGGGLTVKLTIPSQA